MTEQEILINAIQQHQKDEEYENFDDLVVKEFFSEIIDTNDISRFKTEGYGDAGIDYIFTTCNRTQFYEIDDLNEIMEEGSRNNLIDIYFVQVKQSEKIDSNVPNKFIEFADNMCSKGVQGHYNQEINDFITLYTNMLTAYVTKIKLNFHFYYFSLASKETLQKTGDLKGRFGTLESKLKDLDYCSNCSTHIKGSSDVYAKITEEKNFTYTFKGIEKFEVELDSDSNTSNSIIALVPLGQYFNFISRNSDTITDELFESNIRDFKGRSSVNNKINETLSNFKESSNKEFIDFWWMNNGITITVEGLEESKSQKQITIINPQIVNGLQTSYSVFNYFKENKSQLEIENRKIFIKILKILPEETDKELNIIVATNSQNEIRDKDIHANDEVQKNIEIFLKGKGKYYQRKDKYYTNRKLPKNDIIKLTEMAKYINTIFLRDPVFTRNNPGKLLKGKKYDDVFKTNDTNQNYERYYKAYCIYEKVQSLFKGKIVINNDEFERNNFLHHIVYIIVVIMTGKVEYKTIDVMELDAENIDETMIQDAEQKLLDVLSINGISNAKILKEIKEQKFRKDLRNYLQSTFE